uniref:Uncharacterized protein n=1 Tax=Rhizophora mucronata TaxID=61149 RepID=A0A2P2JQQ5_RHIMU
MWINNILSSFAIYTWSFFFFLPGKKRPLKGQPQMNIRYK